jgi:diguanylate cyclase (GGDEF)-like protein
MTLSQLDSDRLQAILEAQARVAAAQLDPDHVMGLAAAEAETMVGGAGASVHLIESEELVCRAGSGTRRRDLGARAPISEGTAGTSLTEDRAVLTPTEISVPLQTASGRLGVLQVTAREGTEFDEQDSSALEVLAVLTSACVQHSFEFAERAREVRLDPVTGLATGLALGERLESEIARARRAGEPMSLVLFEIDDYIELTERDEREAERALTAVSGILKEGRASDVQFRLDGGEFAVLMPGTDRSGAEIAAIRLAWSIATTTGPDPITVTTGIAQTGEGDVYSFITAAQMALGEAKAAVLQE